MLARINFVGNTGLDKAIKYLSYFASFKAIYKELIISSNYKRSYGILTQLIKGSTSACSKGKIKYGH